MAVIHSFPFGESLGTSLSLWTLYPWAGREGEVSPLFTGGQGIVHTGTGPRGERKGCDLLVVLISGGLGLQRLGAGLGSQPEIGLGHGGERTRF